MIRGLEKKHFDGAKETIEKVIEIDRNRREAQQKLDKAKQEAKQLAAQIGSLMKQGKKDEAEEIKAKVAVIKQADKALQETMENAEKELHDLLCTIPNVPNDDVPEGKDASDNVVVKEGGVIPELPADALCHWDLCKKFNLIDFDMGVKITGAGFPSTSARWPACSAPSRLSSSRRHARAATSRCSRPMWSTRHRATAQASCPTRRGRCIIATSTTFTSYLLPRCR